MRLTRRGAIKVSGAAACGPLIGGALVGSAGRSASASPAILRASPGTAQLAPQGYPLSDIWGYGGASPGPVLRLKRGERLSRRFVNDLPQASTVHWHGVRIDNAMDGVPGLTQATVEPGDSFDYDFVCPDAGTYWYHPHDRAYEQSARGLHGALIVEEDEPPGVDRDEVLLLSDWRLNDDASLSGGFGAMHDAAHGGRVGNWVTVNGRGEFEDAARGFERLRLRLVNAATARIFSLGLQGLEGWVVALDGQPLPTPAPAGGLVLAPAQRVDLIVDVVAKEGEEAFVLSVEGGEGYALATYRVGAAARAERLEPPAPLPANGVAALGPLDDARNARLVMTGGAMGSMSGATLNGEFVGTRELVRSGFAWVFNGVAGMPEEPLVEAGLGETVRVEMVNDTAWPHAMHLHGHHFREVEALGFGPWRDTLLVNPGESAEVAFVADNPGDWLLHCHMLAHSNAGMMTWLRVG